MQGSCEVCGAPGAAVRRCTRQRLCSDCRRLPEYRVLSGAEIRRQVPELSAEVLMPLRAGFIPNPVHSCFARVPVYFWKDVSLFCLSQGLAFD